MQRLWLGFIALGAGLAAFFYFMSMVPILTLTAEQKADVPVHYKPDAFKLQSTAIVPSETVLAKPPKKEYSGSKAFEEHFIASVMMQGAEARRPPVLMALPSGKALWGDFLGQSTALGALSGAARQGTRSDLYLKLGEDNKGADLLAPVIILEGAQTGPSLLLSAGLHGDELNGIRVLHRIAEQIDLSRLKGRLILLPGINGPGMTAGNRHFILSNGGGAMADLNRLFPGDPAAGLADRYIYRLWQAVIEDRIDYAIDLHSQTRGTAYPLFVFADFSNPTARALAYALLPDMIKDDRGEAGALETSLIKRAIPAVTFEIGEPKRFQKALIERALKGIENSLRLLGLMDGPVETASEVPFVASQTVDIKADEGGILVLAVTLGQRVEKGAFLGSLFDIFGHERRRFYSPQTGRVLSLATDPLREPASLIVRILY